MDSTMIWGLVRLIIALIVVVPGAIYATRWYGRRQTVGQELRIKEALSLGSNRALYIVEWENRLLLLGVTNQGITLLDQQPISPQDTEGVPE